MKRRVGTVTLAASLIAAGILLLAQNFINITIGDLFKYWPVLLIALGIELVIAMLAQKRENGGTGFKVDGFCIALIIIAAVISNSARYINFANPFEFNFNGNTIIEGIKYRTTIEDEFKKDNISANYEIDTVKIKNLYGKVEVKATSEKAVRIETKMEIKCNDEEKAAEYVNNAIVIEEGTTTAISTRELTDTEKQDYSTAKIDYVVFVPQNVKVEVYGSYGDVDIEGIHGAVRAENSFGDTKVRDIGDNVVVDNSFGQIILENIDGEVIADNKNGRISANNVRLSADLETAFGEIDAENIMGGLKAVSKNGKITAIGIKGKAELESDFGSVNIEGVEGNVVAESSNGEIKAKDIIGDTHLETSFGNINLDSNNITNANIYAETKFGSINTNLQLDVDKAVNKAIAKGNTGEGLYKIELLTKNGSINID